MRARGEDDLARLAKSFNEMADSLQTQIRQLEGLSRVQQRFVSDVSHELRTPLTTIRMAADLIHDSRDGLRPRGVAGRPSCCTTSSTGSRSCWPTCSRSAGSTPARPRSTSTPIDLRGTVARAVQSAQPLADRWGSTITVHAPDGAGATPRSTRAGSSGSCATSSSTPSSTARAGRSRSPSRSTTTAVAVTVARPRRRPAPGRGGHWCSTASGGPTRPGPAPPAAPAWAWRSRSRTPGCTTAGCRRGASPARARASG